MAGSNISNRVWFIVVLFLKYWKQLIWFSSHAHTHTSKLVHTLQDADWVIIWNLGEPISAAAQERLSASLKASQSSSKTNLPISSELMQTWFCHQLEQRGLRVIKQESSYFDRIEKLNRRILPSVVTTITVPNDLLRTMAQKVGIRKLVDPHGGPVGGSETRSTSITNATTTETCSSSTSLPLATSLTANGSDAMEDDPLISEREWRGTTTAAFTYRHAKQGRFVGYTLDQEQTFFNSRERQLVCEVLMNKIRCQHSQQSILFLLQHFGIANAFPLHDTKIREHVFDTFSQKPDTLEGLGSIVEYFGTETAFYFAWLTFYTNWLIAPSLFGLLLWFCEYDKEVNVYLIAYSLGLSVWATLFLEGWKRWASELSFVWCVEQHEADELFSPPRPEFHGTIRVSPITDKNELYYPQRRRYLQYVISYTIILVCLVLVSTVMFAAFYYEDRLESIKVEEWKVFHVLPFLITILPYLPVISYSVTVPILNSLFTVLAEQLTAWENHKTVSSYTTAHVLKLMLFRFVNSYLSLFYLLFVQHDIDRLRQQLITLVVTWSILTTAMELLVPWIIDIVNNFTKFKSDRPYKLQRTVTAPRAQFEGEGDMAACTDLYTEYIEKVIQFGYITLFGWAWPLATFTAFLLNAIEMRTDLHKLLFQLQRPSSRESNGIGVWYNVLDFMSVAVNTALHMSATLTTNDPSSHSIRSITTILPPSIPLHHLCYIA